MEQPEMQNCIKFSCTSCSYM